MEEYNNKWYKELLFVIIALKISNDERYSVYKVELLKIIENENFDVVERESIFNLIFYLDKNY